MHNINMGGASANIGQNSSINIAQFILVQTGTYREQQIRPFSVNVNAGVINRLETATRGGQNLGVAAVQEVAADIVTPMANVEGTVGISEGWNSRRFRFMMKVREQHPFIQGTTTQRILFGYTDQCDVSYNYLDPNMRIYFNSETIVAEAIQNTIHGPRMVASIVGSNQIVSPVDLVGGANGLFSRPTSHMIRPEDIFSLGQTLHVAQRLQKSGMFDGVIDRQIDHRTMVGEGGAYCYSQRRDTSPTRYVSDTLSAYQHAVKEAAMEDNDDDLNFNMPGGTTQDVLYGEASARCRNSNIHSNPFLGILKEHAGYMERGFVTFGDLCRLFPEAGHESVTKYAMDNGQSIRKVNYAEQSENWNGADYTSIGASMLAQVVPSVMMDTFLRSVSFAVTNGVGPGNYVYEFHPNASTSIIDNINMIPYIQEFERRLTTDVLHNLSRNNGIPFRISMHSDLAGDSVIDIAIGGEPTTRFVAPTFSDSLFSPILTRDSQLASTISNDMLHLVGKVIPNPNQENVLAGSHNYVHPVAQPATYDPRMNNGVSNAIDFGLL